MMNTDSVMGRAVTTRNDNKTKVLSTGSAVYCAYGLTQCDTDNQQKGCCITMN